MTNSSQLLSTLRLLLPTLNSTGLCRTEMVPPCPTSCSTTPYQAMNSARVTTNDGMPILDTRKPVRQPMPAPMQTASSISNQALGGAPTISSTAASSDMTVPIQIRSSADSSAATTMPITKA